MGPSTTTWAVESEYEGVAEMRLQWSHINPDAANMGVQTRLSSATTGILGIRTWRNRGHAVGTERC